MAESNARERLEREREYRRKLQRKRQRERRKRRILYGGIAVVLMLVIVLVVLAAGGLHRSKSASGVEPEQAVSGIRETAAAEHTWGELQPVDAIYSIMSAGAEDWSHYYKDDTFAMAPTGSFVKAIKVTLLNQPENLSGTIEYSVNLSGTGWLDWTNGEEAGDAAGEAALEAVRVRLTGDLATYYEVWSSILQNGVWTDWVSDGETAGTEGVGLHMDGLRISVVRRHPGKTVYAGEIDPEKPMVALTYDDGPSATVTPKILDKLEEYGARATFFMVGQQAEKRPAVVTKMVELGCEVANHTYDHTSMNKLDAAQLQESLLHTNQVVRDITGVTPALMRPVGGNENDDGLAAIGALGMPAIRWSVDTLDWKTRDAASTIQKVRDNVKDGDIILMHDLYDATGEASMTIIEELVRQGYQLVTVSELASYRGGLQPGVSYTRFRPVQTQN
jgi:peptidoglycan/xylan/chitin deacetylase (PgdA/CDA1 family)